MNQTIIIGKNSNLSQHLQMVIDNCLLVSARDILTNVEVLRPFVHCKINLVFNNFQPSTALNDLTNVEQYITNAIGTTAKVLDYFKHSKVNKIIYTSSSSVYGNNLMCNEKDAVQPLSLHSALKISNEALVQKFCHENKIDYTLTRVFNMYGGHDKFSIINKLINVICEKNTLTLINQGKAVRDFIHIDDVVKVYSRLLTVSQVPILNIGTGSGESLANLLVNLPPGYYPKIQNKISQELKKSVADNRLLLSVMNGMQFKNVSQYIKEKIVQ
jgi:UDP-glucose 4-epimerase